MSLSKTLHTFEEWKELGYYVLKGSKAVGFYNNAPMFTGAQVTPAMRLDDTRPTPEALWEPPVDEDGEDALALYHETLPYRGPNDYGPVEDAATTATLHPSLDEPPMGSPEFRDYVNRRP